MSVLKTCKEDRHSCHWSWNYSVGRSACAFQCAPGCEYVPGRVCALCIGVHARVSNVSPNGGEG